MIEIAIIAGILAAIAAFVLFRRHSKPVVDLGWIPQYCKGVRINGNTVHIPGPPGVAGTIVQRASGLSKARKIFLRYHLSGSVVAQEIPESPATITLYFQRRGDDWSARGAKEAYRWYASFAKQDLVPGEHTIEASLDGNWTAVLTSSRESNPAMFQAALAEAEYVGVVLGGADGLAHGVQGPATLSLLEWRVE